jgi:hypothetical protein
MPTGTGKTETMAALFSAVCIPRVLVVVPSDALRKQIGAKFETLGILQEAGVIDARALRPIVGQIAHGFADSQAALTFARACNVIITTPTALFASPPDASAALLETCSHLFVDEAHHVEARTWRRIRDAFEGRPVLQFTATPYREDGQRLLGRAVYAFPLREAQRLGYFCSIDYTSVVNFADPDRAIAECAVQRLRQDLAAGLDHVLMARVRRIGRGTEIRELYTELAADLEPVILHSSLPARQRHAGLEALFSRRSRIVICVDMLGEGFDLPALKVAAIHDPHKSLGVTLQFIGRFARVSSGEIGNASVFVGRPEGGYDDRLRRLYTENGDWNVIIRDLSQAAVADEQEVGEFESAFGAQPEGIPVGSVRPKMSTVIYRTHCQDWQPYNVLDLHGEENVLTQPLPVNGERHVTWFVAEVRGAVDWGVLPGMEEVTYHLYVLYWDCDRQLLYINSSDTESHHEELAQAVCGKNAERITGEAVYRAMYNLQRLVPTNVGLLDVRNQSRRFSMLVGPDVSEDFPTAEAHTKTKTNIFASGFENGNRVTIGASLKGRIWSYLVAGSLKHWVDWCDHIGRKVSDETISPDEVMGAFIRPKVLQDRPPLALLALEWPWELWQNTSDETRLARGEEKFSFLEVDLRVRDFSSSGPIRFEVCSPTWRVGYEASVEREKFVYRPLADEIFLERARSAPLPLSSYLEKKGLIMLFEQDAVVVPPALMLRPDRDLPPFATEDLKALDWTGTDITKESQGPSRMSDSIQSYMIQRVLQSATWDVVLDDDNSGEIADIVALRIDGDQLRVLLVHCKFSSKPKLGSRVEELYEVCGQAQKSIRWRHFVDDMFLRLIRRERHRNQTYSYSGFERGTGDDLYRLHDESRLLKPIFTIAIAQPGLSKAVARPPVLHLLASTETYIREVAAADFQVFCNK